MVTLFYVSLSAGVDISSNKKNNLYRRVKLENTVDIFLCYLCALLSKACLTNLEQLLEYASRLLLFYHSRLDTMKRVFLNVWC